MEPNVTAGNGPESTRLSSSISGRDHALVRLKDVLLKIV
jgi:hypothetical protein